MPKASIRVNPSELVSYIRAGMADDAIAQKYNVTTDQIRRLYPKLVERGLLTESDLAGRSTPKVFPEKSQSIPQDATVSNEIAAEKTRATTARFGGMWRSGDRLVVRKTAKFPDICIKTNQPAKGVRFTKKVSWTNPVHYLWAAPLCFLAGALYKPLFLFALISLSRLISKRAEINAGVTPDILQKSKRNRIIGGSFFLGGIAFLALSFIFVSMDQWESVWFIGAALLGPVLILVGLPWYIIGSKIVSASRIDKDYVWLKGVNKEFLAQLPDWDTRQ